MPNKLQYIWRGDYCECVRPAYLPVLTEVRAQSLQEQRPRHVLHWDGAGFDRWSSQNFVTNSILYNRMIIICAVRCNLSFLYKQIYFLQKLVIYFDKVNLKPEEIY